MTRSVAIKALACVSVVVATTRCLDGTGPRPLENSIGVIVSGLVAPRPGSAAAQHSPAITGTGFAYVSLPPSSAQDGVAATVTNRNNGVVVTTVVQNGGFDPVAISANVGDTLAVELTTSSAVVVGHARLVVTARRPPRIVRTNPPPGGRDVPLNSTMVVVFSEPVDSAGLSSGVVLRLRDTVLVSGRVDFGDAEQVSVAFRPADQLAPLTTYQLVVTQAIRDLNGIALDSAAVVTFMTGTTTSGPAVSLAVSGLPSTVPAGVSAIVVTALDASGQTATSYTGTVHFTSTDAIALLPWNYTFVTGDAGVRTFAVTLKTAGDQTITATDMTSITGSEAVVVTVAAAAGKALYVANDGHYGAIHHPSPLPPWSVTVYTGNVAPAATLAGADDGFMERFMNPQGVAVDRAGRLYVADGMGRNRILVFAPGATGNAAPVDSIVGSNTGLSYPSSIAFDGTGRLYVANIVPYPADSYSVTVYAPGATGNATPIATIQGSNTGLSPLGIAVDSAGRLYAANRPGSITVYAAGANGNAAPITTIQGSSTGLIEPISIAVDGSGKIYVSNFITCGFDSLGQPPSDTVAYNARQSIVVFAAGATGNAAPVATLQGTNTGLDGAWGLAVDAAGRLWVANATTCPARIDNTIEQSFGSITVYAPGATGNVAPVARIVGDSSGLFGPAWIVLR